MLECIQNAIGLTRNDCDCYEDNRPEGYNESETDLYIDELDGLPLDFAQAIVNCGDEDGLWSLMVKARENAVITLTNDLAACVAKNYTLKNKTFRGYLGEPGFKKTLDRSLDTYVGMEIKSLNKKATYLTLISIALSITESGDFVVYLHSNKQDDALESYTITTVANRNTVYLLPVPKELPLYDAACEEIEYYLVYAPGSALVKNNKLSCGCGSKDAYVEKYVKLKGIKNSSVTDLYLAPNDSTYSYGLSVSVVLECDTTEVICNNYADDFAFKQYVGQAQVYKAAENLLNYILGTGEINRYTTMNREHLYGKRNHFKTQYVDHIGYLCSAIDLSKTDCYECKKRIVLRKLRA